ncbi:MAG TPA: tyrosine-type recombinase/integrase [Negativicutes bacterium]|nr:tyrosine-type recombinase/integrase [Negativicutes bacterium]
MEAKSKEFNQALEEFLEYLWSIGRSKETISTYKKQLRKYHKYLVDDKNRCIYIDELTSDDLEAYLGDTDIGLSSQTKFSLIIAYKSFMTYCFGMGLCKINTGKEIKQIKPRIKERTSLTEEEFQTLVDNIDNPIVRCVVYTMYYTGCRINELVQLKIDDIDLSRNTISIRKPKGHSQKSRIIPINSKLRCLLAEYMTIRLSDDTEDSFFVLKRSGGISESTVNRAINEAARKAGIERNITNHIIRHTFASLLQEKGIDLKRIQVLLGHRNLETTNIYLHTNTQNMRDAVNLLK